VTDFQLSTVLRCPRDRAWEWISSVDGIAAEMRPYFRMTAPPGVARLTDLKVELGRPLFRSRVFVFGVLPAGSWDLTLVALEGGRGFVEESPSTSMRCWRHERRLADHADGVKLTDHLTFEAKLASAAVGWLIERVFHHRHRVLRERLER